MFGEEAESLYRRLIAHIPGSPVTTLSIMPLIFLAVRLALVPVVWPEKPPMDCIHRETGFEGCGFIFDEAHQIPAVRTMRVLGQPVNLEHIEAECSLTFLSTMPLARFSEGGENLAKTAGKSPILNMRPRG